MDLFSGTSIDLDLNKEEIINKLKTLNKDLANTENNPEISGKDLSTYKLLSSNLLKIPKTSEKEAQLLISCCIMDILRIVAPKEILSSKQIKSVFSLLSKSCYFLESPEKQSYPQILHILRILVDISGSALAVKYNHSGSLLKFIQHMLEFVAANCGHTAEQVITENIRIILEELPDVFENFICVILSSLAQKYKKQPRFRICFNVLQKLNTNVRSSIASYLYQVFFLTKPQKTSLFHTEKYYIGYGIYKINHDYMLPVLCGITDQLQSKNQDSVIEMIGKIASCKKSALYSSNSHLFQEFLKQFESENEVIRCKMVSFTLKFCKNHRQNENLIKEIKKHTVNRLRDSNDKVRQTAISMLCRSLDYIDVNSHILQKLCERLRDVKVLVRKKTLNELASVYYSKCTSRAVFHTKDERYSVIIDEIIKNFKNNDLDDQISIINSIEEIVIPASMNAVYRIKALGCLFDDLSHSSRQIFKLLLNCKNF